MAIWMEIRCDSQKVATCFSSRNNGPMVLSPNNEKQIKLKIKGMLYEAKKFGWSISFKGYVCPECKDKKDA